MKRPVVNLIILGMLAILALLALAKLRRDRDGFCQGWNANPQNNVYVPATFPFSKWQNQPLNDYRLLFMAKKALDEFLKSTGVYEKCGSDYRLYATPLIKFIGVVTQKGTGTLNGVNTTITRWNMKATFGYPCFGNPTKDAAGKITGYPNYGKWARQSLCFGIEQRIPADRKIGPYHVAFVYGLWSRTDPGPYTGDKLTDLPIPDLAKPNGGAWNGRKVNLETAKITKFNNDDVLEVTYNQGSGTSTHNRISGKSGGFSVPDCVPAKLLENTKGLVLAFDVYFQKGWDWSRGGKLLGGIGVGYGEASGLNQSETGASHRVQWKADGAAESYIYTPKGAAQGDSRLTGAAVGVNDMFPAGTLEIERWNHVELGVKMNTFDDKGKPNKDGIATLSINGKTQEILGVVWSKRPDLAISNLGINTFFGGPDPAKKTCKALFKGVALHKFLF